jgi:hypothetical protein
MISCRHRDFTLDSWDLTGSLALGTATKYICYSSRRRFLAPAPYCRNTVIQTGGQ